jgi:hypothetical protein
LSSSSSKASCGAWVFGEQNPVFGEIPVSWQTWSDGVSGTPSVSGDSDWGQLVLDYLEEGRSQVYFLGVSGSRVFDMTEDLYESGQCNATLQIRGSLTSFNQNDVSPSWITYTGPYNANWLYVQVRIIKLS